LLSLVATFFAGRTKVILAPGSEFSGEMPSQFVPDGIGIEPYAALKQVHNRTDPLQPTKSLCAGLPVGRQFRRQGFYDRLQAIKSFLLS
jgi:hypothetical protein